MATRSKQIRPPGWIQKMELRQAASARIPPIPIPQSPISPAITHPSTDRKVHNAVSSESTVASRPASLLARSFAQSLLTMTANNESKPPRRVLGCCPLTGNKANLEAPDGTGGGVYSTMYVYGQAGSKSKRCHTLGAGAQSTHTRAHTHTHGWLACFSRQKKSHCALCPVLLQ